MSNNAHYNLIMVWINVQQEKIEFPDHIEPQRVVKTRKLGTEWRVKWPILYDRHKNVNTINLFSLYWPGSELCHANNQQNIHQPATIRQPATRRACVRTSAKGLFPYYIISYNKQGSFQMIIEDYNKGTKGCQKRLCIIENQKFARKCIYACI